MGTYQFDGIFNNSARYRHGENNNMWILFCNGTWCFSDDFEAKKNRLIDLENYKKGRIVNGVQEIPTLGWKGDGKEYGPYEFNWVIDI